MKCNSHVSVESQMARGRVFPRAFSESMTLFVLPVKAKRPRKWWFLIFTLPPDLIQYTESWRAWRSHLSFSVILVCVLQKNTLPRFGFFRDVKTKLAIPGNSLEQWKETDLLSRYPRKGVQSSDVNGIQLEWLSSFCTMTWRFKAPLPLHFRSQSIKSKGVLNERDLGIMVSWRPEEAPEWLCFLHSEMHHQVVLLLIVWFWLWPLVMGWIMLTPLPPITSIKTLSQIQSHFEALGVRTSPNP